MQAVGSNPKSLRELLPAFIARLNQPMSERELELRAERDRAYAELEAKQEARRVRESLVAAGVDKASVLELEGETSETAAFQAVEKFAKSGKAILLLAGGYGAGKTLAATKVLMCMAKEGRSVLLVSATKLSKLGDFGEDSVELKRAQKVGGLVIDDVGAETINERWLSTFQDLIDDRWKLRASGGVTVLTTNLVPAAKTGKSFKSVYGERVASRIRGDGMIEWCGEQDLRRPG